MKTILPRGLIFRMAAPVSVCVLAGWAAFAGAKPASAKTKTPPLIRVYKTGEPSLLDVSNDGQLILTSEHRNAECENTKCAAYLLAVYKSDTGLRMKELPAHLPEDRFFRLSAQFLAPHFIQGLQVRTVESRSIPIDERSVKSVLTGIQWDPNTNTRSTFALPNAAPPTQSVEDFKFACGIDNGEMLGIVLEKSSKDTHSRLAVTNKGQLQRLQQPDLPFTISHTPFSWLLLQNCAAYRSGNSYLLANGDAPGSSLYWVSLETTIPPRFCRTFPHESLNGYAVSPDGTIITAITSPVLPPIDSHHQARRPPAPLPHAFLNVLDSRTCNVLRRSELEFPEGPPVWKPPLIPVKVSIDYLDNFHFEDQFAKQLAISPDNSKLALAYGHRKASDGIAFFGLYSLRDGHRMTTLRGETYKAGLFHGALLSNQWYADRAPITGRLQFSPDSKYLYASSKYIFQWDVSGLKGD